MLGNINIYLTYRENIMKQPKLKRQLLFLTDVRVKCEQLFYSRAQDSFMESCKNNRLVFERSNKCGRSRRTNRFWWLMAPSNGHLGRCVYYSLLRHYWT